jgi:predicted DNA-binding transcriptional regulator
VSEEVLKELKERSEALLRLRRAPSQFIVFSHLLRSGRAMTIRELAAELGLTAKAAERAVAKLLEKGLIQRTPFRNGAYACDHKQVLLSLFQLVSDLYEGSSRGRGA